jgi:hypothetical protein
MSSRMEGVTAQPQQPQSSVEPDAASKAQRLSELTIDLEDRAGKKGTPPTPTEKGLLSRLRGRADS